MKWRESGFSLIELLIVVAILGILGSAALFHYKRDTSNDKLQAEGQKIASILRGAMVAGTALGKNVNVEIRKTGTPHIRAYIDWNNSYAYESGTDELITDYNLPSNGKVQIENIRSTPSPPASVGTAGNAALLIFLQRGDAWFNNPNTSPTSATRPPYASPTPTVAPFMTGYFMRLTKNPTPTSTPPSPTKSPEWYSFGIYTRSGTIDVFPGYCSAFPCS